MEPVLPRQVGVMSPKEEGGAHRPEEILGLRFRERRNGDPPLPCDRGAIQVVPHHLEEQLVVLPRDPFPPGPAELPGKAGVRQVAAGFHPGGQRKPLERILQSLADGGPVPEQLPGLHMGLLKDPRYPALGLVIPP